MAGQESSPGFLSLIQCCLLWLLLMKWLNKDKDCWVNTVSWITDTDKSFSPLLAPHWHALPLTVAPQWQFLFLIHSLSLNLSSMNTHRLSLFVSPSQLHNKGPSAISSTVLEVGWPSRYKDEHLLYALEIETDGPVTCKANSSLNPLDLEVGRPCTTTTRRLNPSQNGLFKINLQSPLRTSLSYFPWLKSVYKSNRFKRTACCKIRLCQLDQLANWAGHKLVWLGMSWSTSMGKLAIVLFWLVMSWSTS